MILLRSPRAPGSSARDEGGRVQKRADRLGDRRDLERDDGPAMQRHQPVKTRLQLGDAFTEDRLQKYGLAGLASWLGASQHLGHLDTVEDQEDAGIRERGLPAPALQARQLGMHLGEMSLAINERGAGEEVAEPVFERLAQVAHQRDDLALLEADVEQVEGERQAEGIECGVVGLDAAAALGGFDKREGAGRFDAKHRRIEASIEVEQTLDPCLEDLGWSVAGAAGERKRAPERPFNLPAPVRDVVHAGSK